MISFKMLYLKYFPYNPRPFQDELMDRIFMSNIMLCEAPTGSGKSVASLCSFLADKREEEKIVVLTRTKSQADIYLGEIKKISEKIKKTISAVHLVSKQEICPKLKYSDITYEEFNQLCRVSECEYRDRNDCPYIKLQKKLPRAEVIVASYNYLLYPPLRDYFLDRAETTLENLMVIVDEAHNLLNLDILGRKIKEKTVKLAEKELKERIPLRRIFKGEDSMIDISEWIEPEEIIYLYEMGTEILKEKKISFTFRTACFFLNAYKLRYNENFMIYRQNREIFLKPIFPSKLIEPLTYCKKLLLMSATLSPIEGYATLYELEKAEVYSMPNLFPKENRRYLVIRSGLNTRLESRDAMLWKKYAKTIEEIYKSTPRITLVFFPSYEILKEVHSFVNFNVFIEPKENKELKTLIEKIKNEKKALLFAVCGGKLSEGVEFTIDGSSIVKTIVIAGLPFPVPNFELELKRELYDRKFGYGRGYFFLHVLPMVNKTLQATGRAIRSANDRAVVVFLDDRLEHYRYFPQEIREELELVEIEKIREKVEEFHKTYA